MLITKKNKQGLAMATLVYIILVVVALITIIYSITVLFSKSDTKEQEILCHDSIALRMSTQIQVGSATVNLGPNFCTTIDKEIKSSNKEEIKSEIGYMMARCWWMFNEARQDDLLAGNPNLWKVIGLEDEPNRCFLCYTATLPRNIEGDITKDEMADYLLENEHPNIPGLTYIDYFQSYGGAGTASSLSDIKANNIYGIAFLSKSEDRKFSRIILDELKNIEQSGCVITSDINDKSGGD